MENQIKEAIQQAKSAVITIIVTLANHNINQLKTLIESNNATYLGSEYIGNHQYRVYINVKCLTK